MLYNLTEVAAGTDGVLGFISGVDNVLMGGYFGPILLLVITAVVYLSFQFSTGDAVSSLLAASFIGFSMSVFFVAVNLVSVYVLFIFVLIFAIMVAVTWSRA